MLTETTGAVEIDVPRDRDGTLEPKIVAKRQRRLTGVDEMVLSHYAMGLTTGEISAHFAEIYDASVSKETVSRITDRVLDQEPSAHRLLENTRADRIQRVVLTLDVSGIVGHSHQTYESDCDLHRPRSMSMFPGTTIPADDGADVVAEPSSRPYKSWSCFSERCGDRRRRCARHAAVC